MVMKALQSSMTIKVLLLGGIAASKVWGLSTVGYQGITISLIAQRS